MHITRKSPCWCDLENKSVVRYQVSLPLLFRCNCDQVRGLLNILCCCCWGLLKLVTIGCFFRCGISGCFQSYHRERRWLKVAFLFFLSPPGPYFFFYITFFSSSSPLKKKNYLCLCLLFLSDCLKEINFYNRCIHIYLLQSWFLVNCFLMHYYYKQRMLFFASTQISLRNS